MPEHDAFAKLLVRLLPIDLFLALTMTIAWLATVGVRELGPTVVLASVVCAARIAAWIVHLWALLGPVRRWDRRSSHADRTDAGDESLLAATRATDDLPTNFAIRYCVGWLGYILTVVALAWFVFPGLLGLGRTELVGVGLQSLTAVIGPWMLAYPLVHRGIEPKRLALVAELDRRGLDRERPRSSLVFVVTGLVTGLILAPSCWLAAQVIITDGEAARRQTLLEARHATHDAARELDAGARIDLDVRDLALVGRAELPAELATPLERVPGAERLELVDRRNERVFAAAAVADGRFVVFAGPVERGRSDQWIGLFSCALGIVAWALFAIVTTQRSLVAPLASLRDRLLCATKIEAGPASLRMTIARSDEIGELITAFNELLDELEDIAAAANAVAGGDLRVELDGDDHLRVVFRGMVDRLANMVAPVRAAAAEVASAAAALDRTTRSQDHAARQQITGITEVEQAIRRLAESSVAISGSANEVLENAEQTRARADVVVARTTALSQALTRVRGLLEQIREIADRSDLLALNGSLEATRAGEAGRGFALVAAEMRRLAERVGETVVDVRSTLTEVDTSHAAMAEATRQSRELAEHTTAAARQIFEVSREQSNETKVVSSAVREVAGVIELSEIAAGQTRAAADGLREQARVLEHLLERFEVDERDYSQS